MYEHEIEIGLNNPYRFISQDEAINDAQEALNVFCYADSTDQERWMAASSAAKNIGAIRDLAIRDRLTTLLERCKHVRLGETLDLR